MANTVPVYKLLMVQKGTYQDQIVNGAFYLTYSFRWKRNGAYIPGAVGPTYFTSEDDLGQQITCEEQVWRTVEPNDGNAYQTPTNISTSESSPVTVVAGALPKSGRILPKHFSYVGSFALPREPATGNDPWIYGLYAVSVSKINGQKCLLGVGNRTTTHASGHFTIPTDSGLQNAFTVPLANLTTGGSKLINPTDALANAFEGKFDGTGPVLDGTGDDGMVKGSDLSTTGSPNRGVYQIPGTDKMLFSAVSTYSFTKPAFIWRRPLDLTQTQQIEGPFSLYQPGIIDRPRGYTGYIGTVASAYRSLLDADALIGICGLSTVSSSSDGPSIFAFNTARITETVAKGTRGTVVSATANTVRLSSATASTTTGAYKDFWFYIPDFMKVAAKIISYDGASQTVTIEGSWTDYSSGPPTSGMNYKIHPIMAGTALALYDENDFAKLRGEETTPVWGYHQGAVSLCFPDGSKSVLAIGWGNTGLLSYNGNGEITGPNGYLGSYTYDGPKIYDPENSSRGPHAYSETSGTRIWAFDADELVEVKNGTKTYKQSQPYGIWSITVPYKQSGRGIAFDQETNRLYVCQPADYIGGTGAVHVYKIDLNAAVIETPPNITTTVLDPVTQNQLFSRNLSSTGSPTIVWSLTGTYPTWLTLTAGGVLSGTPTTSGSFTFTVRATNNAGSDTQILTLTVAAAVAPGPVIKSAPAIEVYHTTKDTTVFQLKTPAVWENEVPTVTKPGYIIQRRFQWQADGVDIPYAVGQSFTPGRGQAGKQIRLKESAYFVGKENEISVTYSNPLSFSSVISNDVVYHDDIEWLGTFALPNTIPSDAGFALGYRDTGNPTPQADELGGSLTVGPYGGTALYEVSIKAPSKTSTVTARLLTTDTDAYNGRALTSGVIGGGTSRNYASYITGEEMVLSYSNDYPGTNEYPASGTTPNASAQAYFFKADKTLNSANAIRGPFRVTDPVKRDVSRAIDGYISDVPAELQTRLKGTHIAGYTALSGGSNSCDGPSINSFNLADFDSTKCGKFVVAGGTDNQITFQNASNVDNYYNGQWVQLVAYDNGQGYTTTGGGNTIASSLYKIMSYDSVSKTATIDGTWGTIPKSGMNAQIIQQVNANALANYEVATFVDNDPGFAKHQIWDKSGYVANVIIPPGTRSALAIGHQGNGWYAYGANDFGWASNTYNVNITNVVSGVFENKQGFFVTLSAYPGSGDEDLILIQQTADGKYYRYQRTGKVVATKTNFYVPIGDPWPGLGFSSNGTPTVGAHKTTNNYLWPIYLYDPQGGGTGEHSYPYHYRIWMYTVDELEKVLAGQLNPTNPNLVNGLRPSAVWSFTLPYASGYQILGAAYDSKNNLLYVSSPRAHPTGGVAVHIFRIKNATTLTPVAPTGVPVATAAPIISTWP